MIAYFFCLKSRGIQLDEFSPARQIGDMNLFHRGERCGSSDPLYCMVASGQMVHIRNSIDSILEEGLDFPSRWEDLRAALAEAMIATNSIDLDGGDFGFSEEAIAQSELRRFSSRIQAKTKLEAASDDQRRQVDRIERALLDSLADEIRDGSSILGADLAWAAERFGIEVPTALATQLKQDVLSIDADGGNARCGKIPDGATDLYRRLRARLLAGGKTKNDSKVPL